MNRRSAPVAALALLIVTLVAALTLLASPPAAAVAAAAPPVTAGASDEPVTTANPFYPDQRDLTDCVGLVERPGCGSESRGGLHQNLVAIAMVAGLLIVFGRVAWVIRRSNRSVDDTQPVE